MQNVVLKKTVIASAMAVVVVAITAAAAFAAPVLQPGTTSAPGMASAILITVASDRRSFNAYRPSPGALGAPPIGQLSHEFEGTRIYCSGDERQYPIPVGVTESFGWPWGVGVPGYPLERTDPTIPWTTTGQHVTRNEIPQADGSTMVTTDTWSWKLTLEPDAGQSGP